MVERAVEISARNGARPGQRIVSVAGRLGHESVPAFLKAARAETSPCLILDLGGVPGVDSSGVGALLQIYAACQKAGRRLGLVGASEHVQAVLQMCRVNHLFAMFSTVAEAEQQLG